MNIKNIHAIRGLAALLVAIAHAKFILWCGGNTYSKEVGLHSIVDYILFGFDMLSSCASQAVIVFFLLSAFVITHSFKKNQSLQLFAKIRFIRIYIPFIASVFLSLTILVFCSQYLITPVQLNREYTIRLFTAFNETNFYTFSKTLFFIPGKEYAGFNFAYWSLLHEAIFYLLFLLYFKLNTKILATLAIAFYTLSFFTTSVIPYYQTFFVLGILLYRLLHEKEIKFNITLKLLPYIILLLLVCINLSMNFHVGKIGDLLTLLLFVVAIYYLINRKKNVPNILFALSNQSYSLYLFHLPLLMLFYSLLSHYTNTPVFYSRLPYYAGVLFVVLINIPLYYLFEAQSLKLIERLKSNQSKQIQQI